MVGTVEVDKVGKELKINCDCGNVFYVSGDIPTRTVCNECERVIGLRLALKMLKE